MTAMYYKGFDLDGVICPDASRVEKFLCSLSQRYVAWLQSHRRVTYTPPPDALIITSRPLKDRDTTVKWLAKNGITNDVVFNPHSRSFEGAVLCKAEAILKYKVQTYYESDPAQAAEIKKFCPSTEVLVWSR